MVFLLKVLLLGTMSFGLENSAGFNSFSGGIPFGQKDLHIQFLNHFNCESVYGWADDCYSAGVKAWDSKDEQFVRSVFDKLNSNPKIRQFLAASHPGRPLPIIRVTGFDGKWAWVYLANNDYEPFLVISDHFFTADETLSFYGPNNRQKYLLHEMAHIFLRNYSGSSSFDEFIRLAGWSTQAVQHGGFIQAWHYLYTGFDAEVRKRGTEKFSEDARKGVPLWVRDKELANKMGLPSLYSHESPEEHFAELVVDWYFNPGQQSYMSNELRQWLEKTLP